MNHYTKLPGSGTSKATASTLCQKCLKRDIYECKAIAQERPYVSRPSRTQQLLNPKLVPKLNSDVPQGLLQKKGIADEQLAKAEQERGRKRERENEEVESPSSSKRMRSASSISSVSTISTNLSRSRSPSPMRKPKARNRRRSSLSPSPPRRGPNPQEARRNVEPPSPSPSRRLSELDRKRRRSSASSVDSHLSGDERHHRPSSRERVVSRSTRRKFQHHSPVERGRKSESRSPYRRRRRLSNDRQRSRNGAPGDCKNAGTSTRDGSKESKPAPKERSLSPFSKRLVLTQAMNIGQMSITIIAAVAYGNGYLG